MCWILLCNVQILKALPAGLKSTRLGIFWKLYAIVQEKASTQDFSPSSNFLSMVFWMACYILTAVSFRCLRIRSSINIFRCGYLIHRFNVGVSRWKWHWLTKSCFESFQFTYFLTWTCKKCNISKTVNKVKVSTL